uniref:Uncharacterized protein n=1 Tax=Opuntia streptacantha TaxID=393608 RepID=A0A7C8ZL14_OPUST
MYAVDIQQLICMLLDGPLGLTFLSVTWARNPVTAVLLGLCPCVTLSTCLLQMRTSVRASTMCMTKHLRRVFGKYLKGMSCFLKTLVGNITYQWLQMRRL